MLGAPGTTAHELLALSRSSRDKKRGSSGSKFEILVERRDELVDMRDDEVCTWDPKPSTRLLTGRGGRFVRHLSGLINPLFPPDG